MVIRKTCLFFSRASNSARTAARLPALPTWKSPGAMGGTAAFGFSRLTAIATVTRLREPIRHIWAADFTELVQHGKKVYVSTVIDLFTRRILGIHVAVRKGAALTIQALSSALLHHPRPGLFHSDNGREYDAMAFTEILDGCGILISRSRPVCPWENGYQESFYDKFKVDLGDPNRFKTLGELVAEIYRTLWDYNHTRIHSALNMPPVVFAELCASVA